MQQHLNSLLIVITVILLAASIKKNRLPRVAEVMLGGAFALPLYWWAMRFPDIDIYLNRYGFPWDWIFMHRSILTHNALPAMAVLWISYQQGRSRIPAVSSLGISIALISHFVSDLFPRAWWGKAWIHFPMLGALDWIPMDNDWIPTVFSIAWLVLNVAACGVMVIFAGQQIVKK